MRYAVFFDRDGVVNPLIDRGEKHSWRFTAPWTMAEFQPYPEVQEILPAVKAKGYLAIIATNQPGIALKEVQPFEYFQMCDGLRDLGFDDVKTCAHRFDSPCDCRKPEPGLLLEAAREWEISLPRSYMIGDSECDIQAAKAAGCTGILIRRPYNLDVQAPHVIEHLSELLPLIA